MPQLPFAAKWEIKESILTPLKHVVSGRLRCAPINVAQGVTYYLQIFVNGYDDRGKIYAASSVTVFLDVRIGDVKEVVADYNVAVEGEKRRIKYVYTENKGYIIFQRLQDDFFNKYIVNGTFVIKVDGFLSFGQSRVHVQIWDGSSLGDQLWKEEEGKDFTIIVGMQKIKVDKKVLRIRSNVFAAMFDSTMTESLESKVQIDDFCYDVVLHAMKMFYECNFESSLSIDELMSLLQFFDKYNVTSLRDDIEKQLVDEISATTVCRLATHSIVTNSLKLKEKCMDFLIDAMAKRIIVNDFSSIDKDFALEFLQNTFSTKAITL